MVEGSNAEELQERVHCCAATRLKRQIVFLGCVRVCVCVRACVCVLGGGGGRASW